MQEAMATPRDQGRPAPLSRQPTTAEPESPSRQPTIAQVAAAMEQTSPPDSSWWQYVMGGAGEESVEPLTDDEKETQAETEARTTGVARKGKGLKGKGKGLEGKGKPVKMGGKSIQGKGRAVTPAAPVPRSTGSSTPRSLGSVIGSSCSSGGAVPKSRKSISSERSRPTATGAQRSQKLDVRHIREGLINRSHESDYRHIRNGPRALVDNRLGRTVLSRPRKEVLRGTKRKGVLPRSNRTRKSGDERLQGPVHVVEPWKRYRTTYVDVVGDSLLVPRMRLGGRPSLFNNMNVSPRAARPLPGARREFTNVNSRVLEHLPPEIKLPDKEKIVLRNTKLCYSKRIGEWSECDHFLVSRELRSMNIEHGRLMRLTRLREVGDTRGPTMRAYHARLCRKARAEAEETIKETCEYLDHLDSMTDPMNSDREREHWRLAVADRRLGICDAMDAVERSMKLHGSMQVPAKGGARFVIPKPRGLGVGKKHR
eukprot:GEMP01024975.1.p1 GENE.GEMP01024975.1~~GEMP01024975.1.p1  ORF type:complete len:483 (+),score=95.57 GEMP01024975.1:252-1700(+)